MNPQLIVVLCLLGICVTLFIANKPRMDVVALIALIALPLLGIISLPEALAGFSDPNVVLIGALFVVGDGLVRTGVANRIGSFLLEHSAGSETRLLVLLMVSVAVLGSVMSSTGVVAIFIPVVLLLAEQKGLSPRRLMMPLSFAGLISGMLTLVGTAPNLVVDAALQRAGHAGLSFFAFTPFGAAVLLAGVFYMLFARAWLNHTPTPETTRKKRSMSDFVRDYKLEKRELRLRIGHGSAIIGETIKQAGARRRVAANIIAIERVRQGNSEILSPDPAEVLEEGDVLFVDMPYPRSDRLLEMLGEANLEPVPLSGEYFLDQSRETGMAEVMIPPGSQLVGNTLVEASFRKKYRLTVIGIRRKGYALETSPISEKLSVGDVLLVIGLWEEIRALQRESIDLLLLRLPAEIEQAAPARKQAPYALASLAVMVVLMVTNWVPNTLAALIACLLMGLFGCITLPSAYKSIQWPSLLLIIGMIPFSTALQETGGVELAAGFLLDVFGQYEPRVLLAALFALTAIIGLFVSNTATAVLMAPISLTVANDLGLSPYPFAMTVALASSAAFMTPVSSPVNVLVVEPGRYRFGDFLRVGVPFTIIVLVITVLLVPWLMPVQR